MCLSYGLFLCLGLTILLTFLDYGLTYDEETGRFYGYSVLRWYSTFFKDKGALNYSNLYLYGGFFEAIAQATANITQRVFPLGVYEIRHLINALFGYFTIICAYKLGSHLSGHSGGFFSALFLTLTPGFYGHIFNNSKDVPFAALFSFSLYYMLLSYGSLPKLSKGLITKLSIAIGLTLGVRVGAVILFGYLLILWSCWLATQHLINRWRGQRLISAAWKLATSFIIILFLAWALMLIWWPWAQVSPLMHPYTAIKATKNFDWPLMVFFEGRFIVGTGLPWTYLPTWLAISLPEFYFMAFPVGCFLAYKSFPSFKKEAVHNEQLIKIGLLVFG